MDIFTNENSFLKKLRKKMDFFMNENSFLKN